MWGEKKSVIPSHKWGHTLSHPQPQKARPFTLGVACMLQCINDSGVGCAVQGMAKALSSIVMGGPVWECRKKTPLSAHSHSTPNK
jgi:hypothetical protein